MGTVSLTTSSSTCFGFSYCFFFLFPLVAFFEPSKILEVTIGGRIPVGFESVEDWYLTNNWLKGFTNLSIESGIRATIRKVITSFTTTLETIVSGYSIVWTSEGKIIPSWLYTYFKIRPQNLALETPLSSLEWEKEFTNSCHNIDA